MISSCVCFINVSDIKGKHGVRKQIEAEEGEQGTEQGEDRFVPSRDSTFVSSERAQKLPHEGSCCNVFKWLREGFEPAFT